MAVLASASRELGMHVSTAQNKGWWKTPVGSGFDQRNDFWDFLQI